MENWSVKFQEPQENKANSPKVYDKLDDLETGNPFLPPNANAPSALKVVPVHNDMYHEIKCNWNPGDRR